MLFLLETNVPTTRYVDFGAGEKLKIFGRMNYKCNYVAYELNSSLCCFIVSCSRHRCDAPGTCICFFKPRFCLRRVLVMTYVGGLRSPAPVYFRARATRLLGEVRAAVGDDGVTRRDATTSEREVRTDSSLYQIQNDKWHCLETRTHFLSAVLILLFVVVFPIRQCAEWASLLNTPNRKEEETEGNQSRKPMHEI